MRAGGRTTIAMMIARSTIPVSTDTSERKLYRTVSEGCPEETTAAGDAIGKRFNVIVAIAVRFSMTFSYVSRP
jgi:hypothetical protein